MPDAKWLPLMAACYRGQVSPTVLYRAAALQTVRSRVGEKGRLEYRAADIDKLLQERAAVPA